MGIGFARMPEGDVHDGRHALFRGRAHQRGGQVSTINEAIEIAQGNFQHRLNELDRGGAPMCPERYVVWASSREGDYEIVSEIEPA